MTGLFGVIHRPRRAALHAWVLASTPASDRMQILKAGYLGSNPSLPANLFNSLAVSHSQIWEHLGTLASLTVQLRFAGVLQLFERSKRQLSVRRNVRVLTGPSAQVLSFHSKLSRPTGEMRAILS